MINFSKSQSLNSRLILSFYLFICCSQTLVYANIGCQFQFLKGKSLLISVAGPQDEKERSILAALQVENENSCAEFCCDFDLVDKSKTVGDIIFSIAHKQHNMVMVSCLSQCDMLYHDTLRDKIVPLHNTTTNPNKILGEVFPKFSTESQPGCIFFSKLLHNQRNKNRNSSWYDMSYHDKKPRLILPLCKL